MSLWGQSVGSGLEGHLSLQLMAKGLVDVGVGLGAELPTEGLSTPLVVAGAGEVAFGGAGTLGAAKNGVAILFAMSNKGNVSNPDGSKGASDHQEKVSELVDKAKGEAKAGEKVESNKQVKGLDSTRRPDAQIVDAEGKTRKIFEAERHPNRQRNKKREAEYKKLKVENETHPLN